MNIMALPFLINVPPLSRHFLYIPPIQLASAYSLICVSAHEQSGRMRIPVTRQNLKARFAAFISEFLGLSSCDPSLFAVVARYGPFSTERYDKLLNKLLYFKGP